jgi:hypothetical protein
MRIRDHRTAPHSPLQNGHGERFTGSIRHESLDHLVVFEEAQLRRVLKNSGHLNSGWLHQKYFRVYVLSKDNAFASGSDPQQKGAESLRRKNWLPI